MSNRYVLQHSSTQPDGWVLTDTQNNVVVQFSDGDFNGSQRVTMLDDAPYPPVHELAKIMREIGEHAARYYASKCFDSTYGFEYDNEDRLCLYRRKRPKWRLQVEDETDGNTLAISLRKAAEFVTKKNR